MTRSQFLLIPLLTLAACASPQQQCINTATHDLRTVEALIADAQATLQRGYAYTQVTKTVPEYVDCTPNATKANPDPETQMCLVDTAETFRQPIAVDLKAEQVKLDQLLTKRTQLAKQSVAPIATCQAQYPEK